MGRPPTPPRTYVTRHMRFKRALDVALRRAAAEERRGFNDLVQIVLEEWIAARAASPQPPRSLLSTPVPTKRRRRQPGEPPRES